MVTAVSKEEVDKYQKLLDKLDARACEILAELHEIDEVEGFEFLAVHFIDDYEVVFGGEERWSYGGYKEYDFSIPTRSLYDEDYFEELKEQRRAWKRQQEEDKRFQEENDKKYRKSLYIVLKKEFEDSED